MARPKTNPFKAAATAYGIATKQGISVEGFDDVGRALEHIIGEIRVRQKTAKQDLKQLDALAAELGLNTTQDEFEFGDEPAHGNGIAGN